MILVFKQLLFVLQHFTCKQKLCKFHILSDNYSMTNESDTINTSISIFKTCLKLYFTSEFSQEQLLATCHWILYLVRCSSYVALNILWVGCLFPVKDDVLKICDILFSQHFFCDCL